MNKEMELKTMHRFSFYEQRKKEIDYWHLEEFRIILFILKFQVLVKTMFFWISVQLENNIVTSIKKIVHFFSSLCSSCDSSSFQHEIIVFYIMWLDIVNGCCFILHFFLPSHYLYMIKYLFWLNVFVCINCCSFF